MYKIKKTALNRSRLLTGTYKTVWSIVRAVLLIGLSFIILYPLIYMVSIAFRPLDELFDPSVVWIPKHLTLKNIKFAMEKMNMLKPVGTEKMCIRDRVKGESIATDFIDVSVDSDGFVAALDFTKGRIFQYDSSCELTFIFGGKSDGQLGTFISPAAVESADGSIFVLDSAKKSVTVFKPTEIGKTVRKAILLHNEGRYSDAAEYWNSVIAVSYTHLIDPLSLKNISCGLLSVPQPISVPVISLSA